MKEEEFKIKNIVTISNLFVIVKMEVCKTWNSRKVSQYANRDRKKARDIFLNELCKGMFGVFQKNGNKLPHRHLTNLLKEAKPDNEWLTHNVLNKAFIKYRSK